MSNEGASPAQPEEDVPPARKLAHGPPRPGPRQSGPRGPLPFRRSETSQPQVPPEPAQPKAWGENKPNRRRLDAEIEQELQEVLSDESLMTALSGTQKDKSGPRPVGQRRVGRIVSIAGNDVFVEIPGGRSQGVLPLTQFEGKRPAVGDNVEFKVERFDAANGLLILSREGSVQSVSDWSSLHQGMVVEARVTGINKNQSGLLVEVSGIKGFMPVSQIDLHRVESLETFMNQRLKCMVMELNPQEKNLILSRRILLERERQQQAEEFWATLHEGKILRGTVSSIRSFGAFVDLGPADGLLPVSEFSWQRVDRLEEYVKPGQEVEVMVARLDRDARKISLSMRALQADPFEQFTANNRAGSRITGKVTRITEFGAFVELAPGVEGLIHISELSTTKVRKVRDVVAENDTVHVQILSIDVPTRRIALSLKAIAEESEEAQRQAEEAERSRALERLKNRQPNPNLRGGLGGGVIRFG